MFSTPIQKDNNVVKTINFKNTNNISINEFLVSFEKVLRTESNEYKKILIDEFYSLLKNIPNSSNDEYSIDNIKQNLIKLNESLNLSSSAIDFIFSKEKLIEFKRNIVTSNIFQVINVLYNNKTNAITNEHNKTNKLTNILLKTIKNKVKTDIKTEKYSKTIFNTLTKINNNFIKTGTQYKEKLDNISDSINSNSINHKNIFSFLPIFKLANITSFMFKGVTTVGKALFNGTKFALKGATDIVMSVINIGIKTICLGANFAKRIITFLIKPPGLFILTFIAGYILGKFINAKKILNDKQTQIKETYNEIKNFNFKDLIIRKTNEQFTNFTNRLKLLCPAVFDVESDDYKALHKSITAINSYIPTNNKNFTEVLTIDNIFESLQRYLDSYNNIVDTITSPECATVVGTALFSSIAGALVPFPFNIGIHLASAITSIYMGANAIISADEQQRDMLNRSFAEHIKSTGNADLDATNRELQLSGKANHNIKAVFAAETTYTRRHSEAKHDFDKFRLYMSPGTIWEGYTFNNPNITHLFKNLLSYDKNYGIYYIDDAHMEYLKQNLSKYQVDETYKPNFRNTIDNISLNFYINNIETPTLEKIVYFSLNVYNKHGVFPYIITNIDTSKADKSLTNDYDTEKINEHSTNYHQTTYDSSVVKHEITSTGKINAVKSGKYVFPEVQSAFSGGRAGIMRSTEIISSDSFLYTNRLSNKEQVDNIRKNYNIFTTNLLSIISQINHKITVLDYFLFELDFNTVSEILASAVSVFSETAQNKAGNVGIDRGISNMVSLYDTIITAMFINCMQKYQNNKKTVAIIKKIYDNYSYFKSSANIQKTIKAELRKVNANDKLSHFSKQAAHIIYFNINQALVSSIDKTIMSENDNSENEVLDAIYNMLTYFNSELITTAIREATEYTQSVTGSSHHIELDTESIYTTDSNTKIPYAAIVKKLSFFSEYDYEIIIKLPIEAVFEYICTEYKPVSSIQDFKNIVYTYFYDQHNIHNDIYNKRFHDIYLLVTNVIRNATKTSNKKSLSILTWLELVSTSGAVNTGKTNQAIYSFKLLNRINNERADSYLRNRFDINLAFKPNDGFVYQSIASLISSNTYKNIMYPLVARLFAKYISDTNAAGIIYALSGKQFTHYSKVEAENVKKGILKELSSTTKQIYKDILAIANTDIIEYIAVFLMIYYGSNILNISPDILAEFVYTIEHYYNKYGSFSTSTAANLWKDLQNTAKSLNLVQSNILNSNISGKIDEKIWEAKDVQFWLENLPSGIDTKNLSINQIHSSTIYSASRQMLPILFLTSLLSKLKGKSLSDAKAFLNASKIPLNYINNMLNNMLIYDVIPREKQYNNIKHTPLIQQSDLSKVKEAVNALSNALSLDNPPQNIIDNYNTALNVIYANLTTYINRISDKEAILDKFRLVYDNNISPELTGSLSIKWGQIINRILSESKDDIMNSNTYQAFFSFNDMDSDDIVQILKDNNSIRDISKEQYDEMTDDQKLEYERQQDFLKSAANDIEQAKQQRLSDRQITSNNLSQSDSEGGINFANMVITVGQLPNN